MKQTNQKSVKQFDTDHGNYSKESNNNILHVFTYCDRNTVKI